MSQTDYKAEVLKVYPDAAIDHVILRGEFRYRLWHLDTGRTITRYFKSIDAAWECAYINLLKQVKI